MNLTAEGIKTRDEIVFQEALRRKIPVAMVLSGGYARGTAQVIGDSIHNLVTKFNLLQRCENNNKFIPHNQPMFMNEDSASEEQQSLSDDEHIVDLTQNNTNQQYDSIDRKEFILTEQLSNSRDSVKNNNLHMSNDSASLDEEIM